MEKIKSILLKNPEYDHQYIAGWLKEFDKTLVANFLNTFKHLLKEIQ